MWESVESGELNLSTGPQSQRMDFLISMSPPVLWRPEVTLTLTPLHSRYARFNAFEAGSTSRLATEKCWDSDTSEPINRLTF